MKHLLMTVDRMDAYGSAVLQRCTPNFARSSEAKAAQGLFLLYTCPGQKLTSFIGTPLAHRRDFFLETDSH